MALGLFVSAFARTEFQAVQFMPAIIFPQLLLCGLFIERSEMATLLYWLSWILPLTYAYDGLARATAPAPWARDSHWTSSSSPARRSWCWHSGLPLCGDAPTEATCRQRALLRPRQLVTDINRLPRSAIQSNGTARKTRCTRPFQPSMTPVPNSTRSARVRRPLTSE